MTIEQELIKAQSEANAARQDAAELTEKLSQADATISTAKQTISTLGHERDAAISRADATAAQLKAEKDARAADAKTHGETLALKEAEVEKRANLKLHERATQLGINPISEESSKAGGVRAMKRVEFFNMSPSGQREFILSGGRIND